MKLGKRSSQSGVTSTHRSAGTMTRGVVKNICGRSNIRDRGDECLGLPNVIEGIPPVPGTTSVNKSRPSIVFELGRLHVEHPVNGSAPSQDFPSRLGHRAVVYVRLSGRHVPPIVGSSNERPRKCVPRNIWGSKPQGSVKWGETTRNKWRVPINKNKKTYRWNREQHHPYHQLQ